MLFTAFKLNRYNYIRSLATMDTENARLVLQWQLEDARELGSTCAAALGEDQDGGEGRADARDAIRLVEEEPPITNRSPCAST